MWTGSKARAKRSRKLTQVDNLRYLITPFGHDLRVLAMACDDLRSLDFDHAQIYTQVNASCLTVWPPNASWFQYCFLGTGVRTALLKWFLLQIVSNLRLLASPFGHPSKVCASAY